MGEGVRGEEVGRERREEEAEEEHQELGQAQDRLHAGWRGAGGGANTWGPRRVTADDSMSLRGEREGRGGGQGEEASFCQSLSSSNLHFLLLDQSALRQDFIAMIVLPFTLLMCD